MVTVTAVNPSSAEITEMRISPITMMIMIQMNGKMLMPLFIMIRGGICLHRIRLQTVRIGQTNQMTVCKLIMRNTIEEKILDLHGRKKDLMESVLGGTGQLITNFSKEELLSLLD